jgi:ATPase subunit of ABC transporter with duplicated ATPase domains
MSASITISQLAYSTPGGHRLFSGLDLSFGSERTGLVGRNGVGKSTLLNVIAGARRPLSGKVSIDGRIGFLRQAVQVGPRETIADLFGVAEALDLLRRAEAGLASVEEIAEADWTLEERIRTALACIGLDAGPSTLLTELSGGQRTRASLAGVVFAEPDFLLLDEPTNNLDRDGREAVIDLLADWRAGAIVVSHDRELLERMDSIVELTTLGAARYGGNWSTYRERKAVELAAAEHDLAHAEKRIAEVARKIQTTKERKERRDAAGGRKRAKGDMPRILLGGRKDRAEGTGGENARLAERRRDHALEAAAAARARIENLKKMSISLPSTGLHGNKIVLEMTAVSVGYEPKKPIIEGLSFTIIGPERVAVTGRNGAGKTTLLRLIAGRLRPYIGTVFATTDMAMMDQQVSILDPSISVRDNFSRLNPQSDESACRASLARFLFRSDDALQPVGGLSGGQLLRAGLACVLGASKPPSLLILDEPTNHLDLPSIEAVEAGLNAYDGALLLVSHDEAFMEAVGVSRRLSL